MWAPRTPHPMPTARVLSCSPRSAVRVTQLAQHILSQEYRRNQGSGGWVIHLFSEPTFKYLLFAADCLSPLLVFQHQGSKNFHLVCSKGPNRPWHLEADHYFLHKRKNIFPNENVFIRVLLTITTHNILGKMVFGSLLKVKN